MLYLTEPERLGEILGDEPRFRGDQLRAWLYEHPVLTTEAMTDLPADLRAGLADDLWPFEVETVQTADRGRTVKWLFRAPDGAAIEAVLMGYPSRTTLCISSQAGCAMACTFCATGQFGFERHLDAGEIVAQVAYARAWLTEHGLAGAPDRLTNVVYMGMGEPLANYPNLRESLRRLIDVMDLAARSITVSTVGVLPGIKSLTEEPWQVRLALSLHAADDELREQLVPLTRRYPIEDLLAAAAEYRRRKGRRVSLEWTLMEDVNDGPDQARALGAIAVRLDAHVNVIALNATPLAPMLPPSSGRVAEFVAEVGRSGAKVTLRDTRGADIDAACGQLRARAAD